VVECCEVKASGFSSAHERARGGRATRLALAERLRDQTTVLEGSRICCSPPLAPGSAGQQAGFRIQHYESIEPSDHLAICPCSIYCIITMLFAWLCLPITCQVVLSLLRRPCKNLEVAGVGADYSHHCYRARHC
jgi:hypothetical protein